MPQIVLPDRLDQLLAPPRSVESDVATLLKTIFDRKYTGPLTLHFHDGVPKVAEFVAPQVRLA